MSRLIGFSVLPKSHPSYFRSDHCLLRGHVNERIGKVEEHVTETKLQEYRVLNTKIGLKGIFLFICVDVVVL